MPLTEAKDEADDASDEYEDDDTEVIESDVVNINAPRTRIKKRGLFSWLFSR